MNAFVLGIGYHFFDGFGLIIALSFTLLGNLFLYYKSDTLVVQAFGAKKLDPEKYSYIYDIVADLTAAAKIPMPKLWLVEEDIANAFATGRNPENSSVAVTRGILNLLNPDELRAVLAHEISHIINRDILISTIAVILASTISILADMLRWQYYFGFGNKDRRDDRSALSILFLIICAPLMAMLLQLAISRTREFLADESGAKLSHSPLDLATALMKIENFTKNGHSMSEDAPEMKKMLTAIFFASPFKRAGNWLLGFFSTHPETKERISRLEKMKL